MKIKKPNVANQYHLLLFFTINRVQKVLPYHLYLLKSIVIYYLSISLIILDYGQDFSSYLWL